MKQYMKPPEFTYIGRKPCGCVVACVADYADKETGQAVSEFIQAGLAIERVKWSDYRNSIVNEVGFMSCYHGQIRMDI